MIDYDGDSFFTLTLYGRIGLIVLSLCLALACIVISRWIGRAHHLVIRALIAVTILWVFLWISPQIYYTYYFVLFDNLPIQSVIKWPESLMDIWTLLMFSDRSNLSNHTKAILGWGLILHAFWPFKRYLEPQMTQDS